MVELSIDRYEAALALIGLAALVAAWAPTLIARRPLSLPVVLLAFGAGVALLPLGFPDPDPQRYADFVERATEFAVIVSLMGAGLKIDRPFALRTWGSTFRMLGIAMPLTIAGVALLGVWVAGLGAAAALLLGSVLAPTDPVLASDVQVGEPTLDDEPVPDAEDEVRFTLTSEAGLNDALAFPFVYAAIHAAEHDWSPSEWVLGWLAWDLVARLAIAALVGLVVGRLLAVVAFRAPGPLPSLGDTPQGFVALAATLLAYGTTEMLQGYGFLAVFVVAVVLRSSQRDHELHTALHDFTDQAENLLVVALLLLFGGALVTGALGHLTWGGAAVAVLLVLVVRPLSGRIALAGVPLHSREKWAIAFFGIRGFGSVYYLAYALSAASFEHERRLWAIVALALVLSIGIHGITSTAGMRHVDEAARVRRGEADGPDAATSTGT